MAKIIAITSQQGGTGQTKTTMKMAESLAAANKKGLIIDLDSRGTSSSVADIDRLAITGSSYDLIMGKLSLDEIKKDSRFPGLEVVPAGSDPLGVESTLFEMICRERVLKNAIDAFKNAYDYIFIDCPTTLGLLTINALAAAEGVIIPIQTEQYSHKDLSDLKNTIILVKQDLNPSLTIEGVILIINAMSNNLTQQAVQTVRNIFGNHVHISMIIGKVGIVK